MPIGAVAAHETVTRYAFERSYFRADYTVRPKAFYPDSDGDCSVMVTTGLNDAEIKQVAAVHVTPVRGLPLTGSWQVINTNIGRTFTDTISISLDAPTVPGPISGRLTTRGVACGALDEPLTGNWDGTELRFESTLRPNVNTQRQNLDCGTGRVTYILKRKAGTERYEGEFVRDGMDVRGQVSLAP